MCFWKDATARKDRAVTDGRDIFLGGRATATMFVLFVVIAVGGVLFVGIGVGVRGGMESK